LEILSKDFSALTEGKIF